MRRRLDDRTDGRSFACSRSETAKISTRSKLSSPRYEPSNSTRLMVSRGPGRAPNDPGRQKRFERCKPVSSRSSVAGGSFARRNRCSSPHPKSMVFDTKSGSDQKSKAETETTSRAQIRRSRNVSSVRRAVRSANLRRLVSRRPDSNAAPTGAFKSAHGAPLVSRGPRLEARLRNEHDHTILEQCDSIPVREGAVLHLGVFLSKEPSFGAHFRSFVASVVVEALSRRTSMIGLTSIDKRSPTNTGSPKSIRRHSSRLSKRFRCFGGHPSASRPLDAVRPSIFDSQFLGDQTLERGADRRVRKRSQISIFLQSSAFIGASPMQARSYGIGVPRFCGRLQGRPPSL